MSQPGGGRGQSGDTWGVRGGSLEGGTEEGDVIGWLGREKGQKELRFVSSISTAVGFGLGVSHNKRV